jgi:hypothetical protein
MTHMQELDFWLTVFHVRSLAYNLAQNLSTYRRFNPGGREVIKGVFRKIWYQYVQQELWDNSTLYSKGKAIPVTGHGGP